MLTIYGRWDDDGRTLYGQWGQVILRYAESFEARVRWLPKAPSRVSMKADYRIKRPKDA